eukprot:10392650-Alexandrium_andersonii.AAC.1
MEWKAREEGEGRVMDMRSRAPKLRAVVYPPSGTPGSEAEGSFIRRQGALGFLPEMSATGVEQMVVMFLCSMRVQACETGTSWLELFLAFTCLHGSCAF